MNLDVIAIKNRLKKNNFTIFNALLLRKQLTDLNVFLTANKNLINAILCLFDLQKANVSLLTRRRRVFASATCY